MKLTASFAIIGWLLLWAAPPPSKIHEWAWYAGDPGGNHYSPLTGINRGNVGKLELAWEWHTGEQPIPEKGVRPGAFEASALLIIWLLQQATRCCDQQGGWMRTFPPHCGPVAPGWAEKQVRARARNWRGHKPQQYRFYRGPTLGPHS